MPDGELFNKGKHVWASFPTSRHSERTEEVGSGSRALILVFFPLDCVGEVVSWMA